VITEVRLRNFKCFEALDLTLGPLTILTGTNSAGKSSVLQALLLLRQSKIQEDFKVGGRAVLNGDLIQLGTANATLRDGAGEAPLDIAVVWDDGTEAGWRLTPDKIGYGLLVEVAPSENGWKDRPPLVRCRYVSADRVGPRVSFPTSDVVVRTARDLGPRGEFAAHYLAVHGDDLIPNPALHFSGPSMGIDAEPAASLKLRHEVEAWLGLLVPGVRITAEQPKGLDVVRLAFRFPGEFGLTDERRPTHVGFGLTYVLPIFVALLSAERGSLVMLENPEAHLHPRAQRMLMELIARTAASGVQVIVETHSDHVLNGARLAVRKNVLAPEAALLHFFTHDPATGKPQQLQPRIEKSGALTDWPPGFFDEWDRAIDELLT
jgi:predicted ATPase